MSYIAPLSYTTGDFTVTSLVTDTDAVGKAITVPNLTYSSNYVVIEDVPEEGMLANITSTALDTMETLRYGKTAVKNVYASSSIGAANQIPVKTGVRTLTEANFTIQVTNSVSGDVFLVPIRAWACLQIPTASFISSNVVEYAMGRLFGAMLNHGSTNNSRQVELVRGALIPD